jgi:outer membrane murein-binding lipoprotein Lpp
MNIAKKIVAIVTALTVAVWLVGPGIASAATVQELQAQIAALLAQIQQLQTQLAALQGAPAATCTFTRNLYLGLSGDDVKCLQNYLIGAGYSIPAGATGYYGSQTQSAVAAWQTANGISPAAGYFGPLSRAKYNELVTAAKPPAEEEKKEEKKEEVTLEGEEGTIENFEKLGDPSSEEAKEGEENQKVIGVSFKPKNSDLKLARVYLYFSRISTTSGESYRPWDYFENVSLWLGDKKIAEKAADSSSAWSEEADNTCYSDLGGSKDYRISFTGLTSVLKMDTEVNLYAAVTVKDNLDSANENTHWTVCIPRDGIRTVDATGLSVYAPSSEEHETFTMGAVTTPTLTLSYDSDENEDKVINVDGKNYTYGVEVLKFSLKSKDAETLITDLAVDITSSTKVGAAVSKVKLYKGSTLVKTKTVSTSNATSTTVTFDDIDITIPEDTTQAFTIKADFKALGTNFTDGDYVAFGIDSADVTAEDSQGNAVPASGSAVGGRIYAYDAGIQVTLVEKSAQRTFVADQSGEYDQATFVIKFDVTAFDGDMYILKNATEVDSPGTGDYGVYYDLIATTAESAIEGTLTSSLTSSATAQTYTFKVPEGQTKRFTLQVVAAASSSDAYAKIGIVRIKWNTSDTTTGATSYEAGLDEDWQTDEVYLNVF